MDNPEINIRGDKFWYNELGKLHREDGPAKENDVGMTWYVNGLKHREDGPAVVFRDGSKFWYINGKLHREDGPAIEWAAGHRWFLNDIEYSEEEYKFILFMKGVNVNG